MRYIKKFIDNSGDLLYYFTIYSFIGWFVETTYVYFQKGRFVKMGLPVGPFSPIYGIGALLLIFLLTPVKRNAGLFFAASVFMCSALEYITGYMFRVFFDRVLWDYSNELFNINGIICLKSSLFWGVGAIALTNLLHPRFQCLISRIPGRYKKSVLYALAAYFAIATTAYMFNITGYSYITRVFFRIP